MLERRKVEAQSTAAIRRQMTQFFEATSDGIAFLNRNYVFTFLNRRAREILAPSGELIDVSLWDAYPAAAIQDSPYWINYHRSMDEGVATHFEYFYPEPLNVLFDIHTLPSEDGIILFFRDITAERRDREELLRRREEMERQFAEIEAVYRTAPIGLALFDLDDYHYLRLNDRQAAFFGLKPEQVVGRTLTEMAPIEGLRELFDQVASGGPPVVNFPLEGTLINDPTDHRYWVVSYFPVLGSDGAIQGITASSLEITQQKKAELALIESDKLAVVGRLASSIAHEINNPLESVTNLLYLARNSETLDLAKGYLESADHELQRMAAVTSQTLRFHKQSTSPQAITGEALIRSVLSIYQGRILNSGVQVQTRYRADSPVRCFEGEIRQVISNLLGNALDALAPGGSLFLRTRESTNYVTGQHGIALTLADNGSGMSPETIQKAFRPFYTTKGIMGTGLGLWICKEIIDRHNGAIQVRSRVGYGTAFVVFLPYDAISR
ncbi:PAS domain-containing sensor histidine kinase [Granulicella sibirica]|uniref:histidine kinase n=1 Tax=Granulicella sibirica TaxID=2479048 RepID=A0A4V1L5Y0_9BACT|nr:ATP-binding protein [Granulicella sibirica]RXH57334.1 histidine kinase [Granulicella sibirica]